MRVIYVAAALEQHKISKTEVVDKVIPAADFRMSTDDMCQKFIKMGG